MKNYVSNLNTNNFLVSLIIPVYNAEQYLNDCFESIKNQTYQNLEIIFVDDCSRDNSYNILAEFKEIDCRVVVLRTKVNSGVSAARNMGLDYCKGELIGFCDADDTCELDMIESMVNAIRETDSDMSCCALNRINSHGEKCDMFWGGIASGTVFTNEETLHNWLIGKYIGNSVYTKLCKRTLWENVRFPIGQIFEEAYVIPQLVMKARNIVHVGEAKYNYYCRENSYTSRPLSKEKLVVYEREQYIRDKVLNEYPKLKDSIECFEVRQNSNLYRGAILSKGVDKELYHRTQQEFYKVFHLGIKNRYLSFKDKLKLIELRCHIFTARKKIFKR